MKISEYQKKAHSTAIYPKIIVVKYPVDSTLKFLKKKGIDTEDISWLYPLVGAIGEYGELANLCKKIIRDKQFHISPKDKEEISYEFGDTDWYGSEFCTSLKINREKNCMKNLSKLQSRKKRKKIKGSGDTR